MSSRNLSDAIPELREFAMNLLNRAEEEIGFKVIITSVARTYEEQIALYAQGRQPYEEVNILRRVAGMPPIVQSQNRKVTWTMASKHIIRLTDDIPNNDFSRAIDFGIVDSNGRYVGSDKADIDEDNLPDYLELGELGNRIKDELGLPILWGGDFRTTKDYPHFEWVG